MLANRGAWTRTFVILSIPLLGVSCLIAIGVRDRIDRAEAASDQLDGIYPFAAVAGMEGAIHEEGSLAIALGAGLIDADEFGVAVGATDAAHAEVREELTYHDTDSPVGIALIAIDVQMEEINAARGQLLAGTFEGPASEPYRAMTELTRAGATVTSPLLAPNEPGAPALADLDTARSASGEAVFESTAALFEGTTREPVAVALDRLAAAERLLAETAPAELKAAVDAGLADPDAALAAEGAALIAAGDAPDLFAWADATPAWVLAYGIPEADAIEATISTLDTAAERAERAAIEFVIVSVALALAGWLAAALLTRSVLRGRAAPNPIDAARAAASVAPRASAPKAQ